MFNENNKYIFTFWEPKEKIPAYLKLCMKTWQHFLPEYKIVILDYQSIDEWIGKDVFDACLYENFSLSKQADAIRCAVLKKHGGIWMDTDTIITSTTIKEILNNKKSEFILLDKHIGFIVADKNSKILAKWYDGIQKNIKLYKLFYNNKMVKIFITIFRPKLKNKLEDWDFLGNYILKRPLKTKNTKKFLRLNKHKLKAFPENNWQREYNNKLPPIELYREFYFGEKDYSNYALSDTHGIISLHNSWTPDIYKQMTEEDFLKQNNTISNIIKTII